MPVTTYADGTASIKIDVQLLPGSSNGTFNFSISKVANNELTLIDDDISIMTADSSGDDGNKFGTITIDGLETNTEYLVEEIGIPSNFKFVSLESGNKVITNAKKITVTTSEENSLSLVKAVNTFGSGGISNQKTISPNGDGTHKLSLSVTGSANMHVTTSNNVNVIIVYDVSSSMRDNNVQGTRYTRADQAEDVVHDFVHQLFSYQSSSNSSNIQAAVVTFAKTGTVRQGWTSRESDVIKFFDDGGTDNSLNLYNNNDTCRSGCYSGDASNGTNWEAALVAAKTLLEGTNGQTAADSDPTFVILVTDGAPTASGDGSNSFMPGNNVALSRYVGMYNAAKDDGLAIQSRKNTTLFGIYAYGTEADLLDDLIYYANEGSDRDPITRDGVVTTNYYSATSTSQLNAAIEAIFKKIVDALGVSQVAINDGTTSQVKVSATSGDLTTLLEVETNPSTYNYYLSIPVTRSGNNYTYVRANALTGEDETVTLRVSGSSVIASWGTDSSATLDGTIENNILRYKWVANSLYNVNPPQAAYNASTGSLDWNLGEDVGTLLNGVTYTVEFDVWPSQYTEDLLSKLRNDPTLYNKLPDNVRDYIVDNGDGIFSLRTNTKALITYNDTRDDIGERMTTFDNPDPVVTKQQSVTVVKEWDNTLDPDDYDPNQMSTIGLYITKDGIKDQKLSISRDENNNWIRQIYLSAGNIKTSRDASNHLVAEIRHPGHDFSLAEDDYHWNLSEVEPMHPMLIDGEINMLVKTNEVDVSAIGTNNALERGNNTYYKICKGPGDCSVYKVSPAGANNVINITNSRRSNLNIKKEVTGDYAGDGKFSFTATIVSTEDLWFSIGKPNPDPEATDPLLVQGDEAVGLVSGEGVNIEIRDGLPTGYYSVASGSSVTINICEDWNVRFTNVPKGSTFDIVENAVVVPSMKFQEVNYNSSDLPGNDIRINNNRIWGTMELSNKVYQITYKNIYLLTNVTVTKTWSDGDDYVPDEINVTISTDNSNVSLDDITTTVPLDDSNDWTTTWKNLIKFIPNADGSYTEVVYDVTETLLNDGLVIDTGIGATIGNWALTDKRETATDDGKIINLTNTYTEALKRSLNLTKVSLNNSSTTLNGAKFKLYRFNEITNAWVQIGNEEISAGSGNVTFANLYAGSYRLVETSAPEGYILPKGEWLISITDNGTSLGVSFSGINIPPAVAMVDDGSERYLIPNEELLTLPETGGFGIGNISLIGILVMLMSGIFLLINQRELMRDK